MIEFGLPLRSESNVEPGRGQTAGDVFELVPIAGQRQARAMCIGPAQGLTGARLEGQEHEPAGVEDTPHFGEDSVELIGRGVDDRVPADQTRERPVDDRERVESTDT